MDSSFYITLTWFTLGSIAWFVMIKDNLKNGIDAKLIDLLLVIPLSIGGAISLICIIISVNYEDITDFFNKPIIKSKGKQQ